MLDELEHLVSVEHALTRDVTGWPTISSGACARSSERYDALILDTVHAGFAFDDQLGGQLLSSAIRTMDGIYELNRILATPRPPPHLHPPTPLTDANAEALAPAISHLR